MIKTKICNRCKVNKPLDYFSVNESSPDKLRSICKKCTKITAASYYQRTHDLRLEKAQEWYKNNTEIKLKKNKIYKENHVEDEQNRNIKWRLMHKKDLAKRKRDRTLTDINYRLICNLRTRLNSAIRNNQKVGSAVRDLGCSIEFLKKYLEDKFYYNMTWNNWGTVWELDHIVPLASFNLSKRKQFLKVVNYKNLQPLTIQDHVVKSKKDLKLIK